MSVDVILAGGTYAGYPHPPPSFPSPSPIAGVLPRVLGVGNVADLFDLEVFRRIYLAPAQSVEAGAQQGTTGPHVLLAYRDHGLLLLLYVLFYAGLLFGRGNDDVL